ncbi:MAG: O-antigen ligase family protein, partial [Chloroflexota bacterium]
FEFLGYLTLAALTVLTILYSQSRGPLMGLMLGLALFPPLLLWRRKMWRWLSGYLVFSLIGGGFLFLFNMPIGTTPLEPLFKIARQNQEIARLGQILETNSGTGKVRQLIWKTDFEIMNNALKNEPWRAFIGYGPESLYNISPPFYQPELAQVEARNAIPDRSHNGYLDALVTTGGLGLLAYVGLVVTFFFYGIKFLRRTNRLDYQVLLAVLMAIMLAHQVEIQVGIQIATTWMLFWISIALRVVLGGLINVSRGIPQMGEVSQQNGTPQANGISQAEPVVTVEEPEPVAALATTSAKSSKTGKQKSRNAQTPPLISESKAASNSPDQLKIKPNRPSIKAASNSSDQLRTKASNAKSKSAAERSSRGTPASNRLVPATEGAFGLGGNVGYSSEYLYRSVRPWFWIAAGAIGIFALTYAYFANYLPIVADGYYKQGTNLGASQNWALAVPYFRKAIEDAPTEDFYYLFLGQAYLEQARTLSADASQLQARKIQITTLFNEGEQALKKAHELAPLNPDHYANLARLYSMWAGADSSRTDEFMTKSVDWYEQVVNSRAPRNARLWTELAASYLNLWASRKDSSNQTLVNKAISAGEQSVKVDDHYDFNRIVLGDIYMSAGKPESAGIHYLKLAEIDANQLNSDSKYTERMRAIAISPQVSNEELVKAFEPIPNGTNQPFRDTTLGAIYYYKDMLSEAEAKLNAALLGDPTNPYNKTYLALIRSKQKRTNEAQALALDAIEQARKVQSNPQLLTIVQQMLSGVLTAQPSATVPNPTIPAGQPTTVTGTTSGASTPTTPLPTKKP